MAILSRNAAVLSTFVSILLLSMINANGPSLPSKIIYYLPINVTNTQASAFPVNGQLMLSINSLSYAQYEANDLQNVEFFYQNGTIINSWLEGNLLNETQASNLYSSSNTIYWLRMSGNFLPASSSNMIFMGFASNTVNLLDGNVVGEAPQLSSQYAEYDNGANVFAFYENFNGNSLDSSWVSTYSPGYALTNGLSMSSGSVYSANVLFNSLSDTLEALIAYTSSSGSSQSGLMQGTGTALSGSDIVYNLDQNAGSIEQQVYAGTSGSDSNLISGVLSGFTPSINQYFVSTQMMYGSTIKSEFNYGNTISESSSNWDLPSYILLGSWQGSASGSTTIYPIRYKWIRTRETPTNGIMPSVAINTICTGSGCQPTLNFTPRAAFYGNTVTISSTSGYGTANTVSIIISGGVFGSSNTVASGIGVVTYSFPIEAAGSYTINAFDQNSLLATVKTLVIQKANPAISLPYFPSDFFYNGSSSSAVTANILSRDNQLQANVFVNGAIYNSFYTENTFYLGPSSGSYLVIANTLGDANYTAAAAFNILYLCPAPALPQGIAHYVCIGLNNYLNYTIPSNTQLRISVNALAYSGYESNTLNNTELFFQNGTIAYSWMEGNISNELQSSSLPSSNSVLFWFKSPPSNSYLGAESANAIYLGFAENTATLMNNLTTGEAPQLSPEYGEYDNGANVFNMYWDWKGQVLPPNWDAYSGVLPSANNGLTITTTASDAGYLYEGASPSLPFIYELYGEGKTTTAYNLDYGPVYINVLYGTNFGNKGSIGGPWIWGTSPYNWEIFSNGTNYNNGVVPTPLLNKFYLLGEGGNSTSSYWAINYDKANGTSLALASGDYIGFWMDYYATSFAYWARTRYLLPNDVQPTSQFTHIESASVVLSIAPSNQITYGSNALVTSTCTPSTDTCQVWEEGGDVPLASGTGSASYVLPVLGAGNYYYYANDITSAGTSTLSVLTVKKATPQISLPHFPSDYTYNGAVSQITANIISLYNQVTANVYVNNVLESSFEAENVFGESSAGTYLVVANSLATGNYLGESNTLSLDISKAKPNLSIINFPQDFFYTGFPSPEITANILSYGSQLSANVFINGVSFNSFHTQNILELGPDGGSYTVTVNTLGNVNYTSATTSNVLYICPNPTVPAGIGHFICITFKNLEQKQSLSGIPLNFTFDAASYRSYESNSLNNTELFYGNGTLVDSWIEGNALDENGASSALSSSDNVLIWFRSDSQSYLPPLSANSVYLGFESTLSNLLNSKTTGEAPQLSTSYGEYDTGANVFTDYWNFEGNTLPSGISSYISLGAVFVENGLFVTSSNSGTGGENGAAIFSGSGVTAPNAIEFYGRVPFLSVDPGWGWIQLGLSDFIGSVESAPANGGSHLLTVLETGLPGSFLASGVTSFGGTISWGTLPNNDNYIPYTTNGVFNFIFNATDYYSTLNYTKPLVNIMDTTSQISPLPFELMLGNNAGTSAEMSVYWLRVRALPANGSAITHSFSSLQTAYSSPVISSPIPSIQTVDQDQKAAITDNGLSGGTPPYYYQWLATIAGGSSGSETAGEANTLLGEGISNGEAQSANAIWPTSSSTPAGVYRFRLSGTDSHPTSSTSGEAEVEVNNALAASPITPISPSIEIGQSVTLTSNPSGGSPPYSYQWYSGSSPSCLADTAINGATSNTYAASPASDLYYCYKVTDSATVPENQISGTDGVSVSPSASSGPNPNPSPQYVVTLSDSVSNATASNTPVFMAEVVNPSDDKFIASYLYYQEQLPAKITYSSLYELNLSFACSFSVGYLHYHYSGGTSGLGTTPCGISYLVHGGTYDVQYTLHSPEVSSTTTIPTTIINVSRKSTTSTTSILSTTTLPNTINAAKNLTLRETASINYTTPASLDFAAANVILKISALAVGNNTVAVEITNYTENATMPPNYTKLYVFDLNVSPSTRIAVNVTMGYNCSLDPNIITPFWFNGEDWSRIYNYIVVPDRCIVDFSAPADNAEIGIFDALQSPSTVTTVPVPSNTINTSSGLWIGAAMMLAIALLYALAKLLTGGLGKKQKTQR